MIDEPKVDEPTEDSGDSASEDSSDSSPVGDEGTGAGATA